MAPGVCLICADTPSFLAPPTPTGHSTDLPTPGPDFHFSLIAAKCWVKTKVVPLPSERCTTEMSVLGNFAPGLAAAILGSFHFLIVPRKMPAYASRVSLRSVTPSRL